MQEEGSLILQVLWKIDLKTIKLISIVIDWAKQNSLYFNLVEIP